MKTIYLILLLLVFCKFGISQNIIIANSSFYNEPSIMMNPKNTNILVVGTNAAGSFYSTNKGNSWHSVNITSDYNVAGDPVIDVDTLGNFYYFHLSAPQNGSWLDRIVCQKSTDNGQSWSNGTYTGFDSTRFNDKAWSCVDRATNNIYLTWTLFDDYQSTDPNDRSNIMFSKSVDGGDTWSQAKQINIVSGDCLDNDSTVEGAVPAVGPNGEIYVAWAGPNGIVFNRSLDYGETWLNQEIIIDEMPFGWNFNVSGISRCNGFPITKCDLNNGTIYVNWSDQRNGTDNTDIWLSKSTDGGNTWSEPKKVNDDTGNKQQFFTWMDIDQTNGRLYFVFYDRRNYSDNRTDVYMAISIDEGNTFYNRKISDSPFIPNENSFFGDYINITAHDNIVRPVWTRLDNDEHSILTDISPISQILNRKTIFNKPDSDILLYPNPTNNKVYVTYKLFKTSVVKLYIYNEKGQIIKHIINNEKILPGKHMEIIDIDELNLSSGTYYYKLIINNKINTLKSIVIK